MYRYKVPIHYIGYNTYDTVITKITELFRQVHDLTGIKHNTYIQLSHHYHISITGTLFGSYSKYID